MAAAIDLRADFGGAVLLRLARVSKDARQVRRLLALAAIYDGGTRSEAARIGGVSLQIIRDWVVRFNARGPDGLIDGKARGARSLLSADSALPSCASSRTGRSRPRTVWCAGASSTWRSGFGTHSQSRSASRR